jgi:hypothetical protein
VTVPIRGVGPDVRSRPSSLKPRLQNNFAEGHANWIRTLVQFQDQPAVAAGNRHRCHPETSTPALIWLNRNASA